MFLQLQLLFVIFAISHGISFEPVTDFMESSTSFSDKCKLTLGNEIKLRGLVEQTDTNETPVPLNWCLPVCLNTSIINNYPQHYDISIEPELFEMGQTDDDLNKKLSNSDWAVIGFLITFLCVIILSTIYDIYLDFAKKRAAHLLLIAFSAITNTKKLLVISNEPDQLGCLSGIRFISMIWIILCHRFISSLGELVVNDDWMQKNARHMFIINFTNSVETFLVLSGLLVSYGFCLARDKGVRFNIWMFYIHRYIRLTPVLGVLVLIHATIISHFGSGPYWSDCMSFMKTPCEKYWWASFLYIQNYYNNHEMCIGQTWQLSLDFQLFILSPIILIPLWKWPKPTLIASGFLVISNIISTFILSYHYKMPPSFFTTENLDKFMYYYYLPTHIRFGTWLMGVMLGYYLFTLKKIKATTHVQRLHSVQVIIGWVLSLTIMLASVFGSYHLLTKNDYISNALWNALHRHVWSLGICWVIFACTQGYGDIINSFLSSGPFQVLGKLTYTVSLTHYFIIIYIKNRPVDDFFDLYAIHHFWGDLAFSLATGFCLTLAFEIPMITIAKILFSSGNGRTDKRKKY